MEESEIKNLLLEIRDVLKEGKERNDRYIQRVEDAYSQQSKRGNDYISWLILGSSCVAIGVYIGETLVRLH